MESPFNRFAGFKTCNVLKKELQHRCFPVNIAKFLRMPILMKICEQLLLQFLLAIVNIFSLVFVSALNSRDLLQRSSSRFKEFSLGWLVVGSSLIWKNEKLTEMVAHCHSLSFVVTRFTTRCHLLSLDVPLVCLFINDHNCLITNVENICCINSSFAMESKQNHKSIILSIDFN